MSTETAVAVRKPDVPSMYGSREEVKAQADRYLAMLPGADKLKPNQRLALAQYALMTGANAFRGELYAYDGKGGSTVLEEGYKLLVRWAKAKCEYSERFEPLVLGEEGLREGDIGARIFVLREDKKGFMRELTEMGATWREAFEFAATSAVGIVRAYEMWSKKNNRAIDPPTGWSWEQVARKRALKNALNLAYGMPSVQEIAKETWNVNGTQTEPQDWENLHGTRPAELAAEAEYQARRREAAENPTVENAVEAVADLFGDEAAAEYVEGTVESEPENGGQLPFPEDEPHEWTVEECDKLNRWAKEKTLSGNQVVEYLGVARIRQYPGDLDAAKAAIEAQIALEVSAEQAEAEVPA